MANTTYDDHGGATEAVMPDDDFFDDNGLLEKAFALGIVLISAAVFLAPTTVGLIFAHETRSSAEPGNLGMLFPLASTWVQFDLGNVQELFFSLPILLGVIFGRRLAVRQFAKWAMVLTLLFVAIGGTIALHTYPELQKLKDHALTAGLSLDGFDDTYSQVRAQIEGTRTAALAFLAALVGLVLSRAKY